ncbi:MAG: phage virion morphogenesis protein [Cetobacterium sp.]|nr:phage virion morphogenesis protein [Cetobacterium sp.]
MNKPLDRLTYFINEKIEKTKNLEPLLKTIAIDIKKETQLNFKKQQDPNGQTWKKNRRGGQILAKTGILKQSFTTYIHGNIASVGTNIPYARIHQYGGTIKPKRGKYLAIPINRKVEGSSPKDFTDTVCIKAKNALYIVRKIDKKGKNLEFLFKLQKEVIIPERKFLGINDKMKNKYAVLTKKYIFE